MGLNDINSLSHSKWNCKYHIVFAPKYRRKVFYGEKRTAIDKIFRELCKWKGVNILEAEACPDHIHLFVENTTTYKASKYSSTYSPKANVKTYSYSNYPSSYKQLSHYWRPNKIYYSSGKVVVNGKFINTHVYTLKYCRIKLTVKCQGKVIGTKP